MTTFVTTGRAGSRSGFGLLMLGGVLVTAMAAGTARAAAPAADAPSFAVHYSIHSLATDDGVRTLYRRIVLAAEEVCPRPSGSSVFVNPAVRACREQAIAGAVQKIDNPKLAQVYASNSKSG